MSDQKEYSAIGNFIKVIEKDNDGIPFKRDILDYNQILDLEADLVSQLARIRSIKKAADDRGIVAVAEVVLVTIEPPQPEPN